MERNPMIKIDYSKLPKIDAIFLSHGHCGHIDPYTLINYTLIEMYQNIAPRPLLLIPETIEFLIPLFKKYLPKQKIKILKNKEIFDLNWIEIQGIIFENNYITNEDDVMTLAISNDEELLYTDVDTLPPESEKATSLLYDVFTRKNYKEALYIPTRNKLEWNFKILEAKNVKERKKIAEEYIELRKEEIAYNYERFEYDLAECSDIQKLPNSNFWHKLNSKKAYRLWTCLWANFLNSDLVYKNFDFHFKRASAWRDVKSFVEKA